MADDTANKNQQRKAGANSADSAGLAEQRWEPGQAPWDRPRAKMPAQRRPGKTLLGFNPEVTDGEVLPFEVPQTGPPDVENDFEAWATVAAKLLKRSPVEQRRILTELELVYLWPQANDQWSAVLAQDFVDERDTRSRRYCVICAEEMKRRRVGPDKADGDDRPRRFIQPNPKADKARTRSKPTRAECEDGPPTEKKPPKMIGPVASQEPTIGFIDRLAPKDIQPQTPRPGQESTAAQDMRNVASAVQAANEALCWPLEKFAKFCAEIDHEPERIQLIAAHYGIRGEAIEFVREGWQERLDSEPDLREQWSRLVARHRQQIQRSRSAKKPPSHR